MDNKVKEFLKTAGQLFPDKFTIDNPKIELAFELIREELQETIDAYKNKDKVEFVDGVIDLYWVFNNLLYFSGIDKELFDNLHNEVYLSNMSKFDSTSLDSLISQKQYYLQGIDTYEEIVNDKFVIKRMSDSKILKSHKFVKPDIKQFLNEQ